MDITISQLLLSLLSGFGGALILHSLTVRESKKACRKAVLKEIEFGIYKAITTVSGFRRNSPHISFKGIELQIYPSAISKHPDLFRENRFFFFRSPSLRSLVKSAKMHSIFELISGLSFMAWSPPCKANDDVSMFFMRFS